ncbi:MAG: serine/threonine-protein kinase, partial [Myxococcota bacterium]
LARTLNTLLSQKERLPTTVAVKIAEDLCHALARAHRPDDMGQPLFHRDVKPDNIQISFRGEVKLLDFGLAGVRNAFPDKEKGRVVGTPSYMAPEVIKGDAYHAASDIWSAGVVLYNMLTMQQLFSRGSPEQTIRAVLNDSLPRNRFRIPRKLFRILKKALEKDPSARYSDAAQMAEELRDFRAKKGTPDITGLMTTLYDSQLELERSFAQVINARSFTEALLKARPGEIARYFASDREPTEDPTVALSRGNARA